KVAICPPQPKIASTKSTGCKGQNRSTGNPSLPAFKPTASLQWDTIGPGIFRLTDGQTFRPDEGARFREMTRRAIAWVYQDFERSGANWLAAGKAKDGEWKWGPGAQLQAKAAARAFALGEPIPASPV